MMLPDTPENRFGWELARRVALLAFGRHAPGGPLANYRQDFLVEALMEAWLSLDNWDPERSALSTWVYRRVIWRLRKCYSYGLKELNTIFLEDSFPDLRGLHNTAESAIRGIARQELLLAVEQLPEDEREVIERHYLREETMASLAREEKCLEWVIWYRKRRALRKLREMLYDAGGMGGDSGPADG